LSKVFKRPTRFRKQSTTRGQKPRVVSFVDLIAPELWRINNNYDHCGFHDHLGDNAQEKIQSLIIA
jgi:hypothetical protein